MSLHITAIAKRKSVKQIKCLDHTRTTLFPSDGSKHFKKLIGSTKALEKVSGDY
jgi:hypothetical protein